MPDGGKWGGVLEEPGGRNLELCWKESGGIVRGF